MISSQRLAELVKCRPGTSDDTIIRCMQENQQAKDAIDQLSELFGEKDVRELISRARDLINRADAIRELVDHLEHSQQRLDGDLVKVPGAVVASLGIGVRGTVGAAMRAAAEARVAPDVRACRSIGAQALRMSQPVAGPPPAQARQDAIASSPGRNRTEKAMAYLASQRPDFAQLDRLDQVQMASRWLDTGE